MKFILKSKFNPAGDQPKAIKELVENIDKNVKHQVLLGATGTGKTFTIANVINTICKPTLILVHNKTLAGQLYMELKELFPSNRVEYFVSYYDYYQPEAYVPSSGTYIEKESSINNEIDELRHSATANLINREDVIVVASVSCIYGIGEKEEYKKKMLTINIGDEIERDLIAKKLIEMQYERNVFDLKRGAFRINGDVIEIVPVSEKKLGFRIEMFGNEVERISEFEPLTGIVTKNKKSISLFPASHFVTSDEKLLKAIDRIEDELEERLKQLEAEGKFVEYQRIKERTNYDLEMLKETGFCSGIENYSRHLSLREEGETPNTLMDFFPDDYLLVIDESHVSIPQVRTMYAGDRARKQTLIDYGFRLPSALDNRPLTFEEFETKVNQVVYMSATPADYELEKVNHKVTEQIIRPTGLLDPLVEVRKTKGQIDNLIYEINETTKKGEKVLITTITIRMAEELTEYLENIDIKVTYLHSKVKTLERMKIIEDLRRGKYDVIVGINLLREGLDIPEVSLIAILDADKQGFLRSSRSLIQTIGRCARNSNGRAILYGDVVTDAMKEAMEETARRRELQIEHNSKNGIIPVTIEKEIGERISNDVTSKINKKMTKKEKLDIIDNIEQEMKKAANDYEFERAAELRDLLFEMKI